VRTFSTRTLKSVSMACRISTLFACGWTRNTTVLPCSCTSVPFSVMIGPCTTCSGAMRGLLAEPAGDRLERIARDHELGVAQHVVDVEAARVENFHVRQVSRRTLETVVLGGDDDEHARVIEPEPVQALDHPLRLRLGERQTVDDDQLAGRVPVGQRRAQGRLARAAR